MSLDEFFKVSANLKEMRQLNAWGEVELYRKFNNGHLPNHSIYLRTYPTSLLSSVGQTPSVS